jgi:hypothetical protein
MLDAFLERGRKPAVTEADPSDRAVSIGETGNG